LHLLSIPTPGENGSGSQHFLRYNIEAMNRNVLYRGVFGASLLALLSVSACEKQAATPVASAPSEPAPAADPAFDSKWKDLAQQGVEALYIEDDNGEGLMGNVRRASDMRPDPARDEAMAVEQATLPDVPPGALVQSVIRRQMSAVKGCYMSMSRSGPVRSGKAIVTFGIGADGAVSAVKVDAPNFAGTSLSKCVSSHVARWSFPKSQKGGGSVSYPFVFVGG